MFEIIYPVYMLHSLFRMIDYFWEVLWNTGSGLEFDFTLLKSNKLASYYFLDVSRSQEISGSEIMAFYSAQQ